MGKALLATAALSLALAAAAAAADRLVRNPGAVASLSVTASDVAYATAAKAPACPQVVLWRTSTRATIHFPRAPRICEQTSTGTGIAGVATAGGRVLWLFYTGGNIREWTLYTASTSRRAPKQIRFVARDVDAPAPVVLGRPDELDLPYAVDDQVIDVSPNGSRRWSWTAPGPVAQLAAGNGQVAVQLRDGTTYVLSHAGRPGPAQQQAPGTIRLAFPGLAHQDGTNVVLAGRSYPVGRGGQLVDYLRNVIVYRRGAEIRGIRTSDGKDVLLRRGAAASFHRAGLGYATGSTVRWAPWSSLARLFGD